MRGGPNPGRASASAPPARGAGRQARRGRWGPSFAGARRTSGAMSACYALRVLTFPGVDWRSIAADGVPEWAVAIGTVALAVATFLLARESVTVRTAAARERRASAFRAALVELLSDCQWWSHDPTRSLAAADRLQAYNAAIDAAFKKYVANGQWLSLGAFRAYYKTTATLDRRFADNLRKTIWPAACAADVKLLLRQVAANEAADLRASTARDWTDATTLDTLAGKASAVAQDTANLVRADLGLPSVPVIRP